MFEIYSSRVLIADSLLFPLFRCGCESNTSLQRRTLTSAVLRDQYNAKARLPGHHPRVRSRGFLESDGFNHGGHAGQRTESERCLTNRRSPRQGAFYLAISEYEIRARDLGVGPEPSDTPPGRRPLKVSASVLPPEAV